MLVHVEPAGPERVRASSPLGNAVVRWHGDTSEGHHHVEWTVDEDAAWGVNAHATTRPEPAFWQEEGRIVLRGRLRFDGETSAHLQMGEASILLDTTGPFPVNVAWVELRVAEANVSLWPYSL